MPRKYPAEVRHQVIELARSGTKVAQLAETFGMSDATIYNWLKIDSGEIAGLSTEEALELAAGSASLCGSIAGRSLRRDRERPPPSGTSSAGFVGAGRVRTTGRRASRLDTARGRGCAFPLARHRFRSGSKECSSSQASSRAVSKRSRAERPGPSLMKGIRRSSTRRRT